MTEIIIMNDYHLRKQMCLALSYIAEVYISEQSFEII